VTAKKDRTATKYYILDAEHRPVEADFETWARFFENNKRRRVAHTQLGDVCVSTVFLGLDHRFGDDGPPIVFETMIFGGPLDQERCLRRYSSWDDAEAGHAAAVRKARATVPTLSGGDNQEEKP
jgi:hypothetical protein